MLVALSGPPSHVVIVCVLEDDIQRLREGIALPWSNSAVVFTGKTVLLMWARDKAHFIEQMQAAGVGVNGYRELPDQSDRTN